MKLCEMNPYVRFARVQKTSLARIPSIARDHRIFCCLTGNGKIQIGGKNYPVQKGVSVYIRSGTVHYISVEKEPIVWIGCNFDFFRTHSAYIPPTSAIPAVKFNPDDVLEKTLFSDSELFSDTIYLIDVPFEPLFSRIVREYAEFSRFSDEICSAQLKELLFKVAKCSTLQTQSIQRQAEEILVYIHGHYAEKLTNKAIAERFSYHPNYISALIRSATGVPLHRYLMQYRVHRATILLQSTDMSVSEIGAEIGMPDLKAFSKCFTSVTGSPPSSYRSRERG